MIFRTEFKILPSEIKIGYESDVLMLGSCFSENISMLLNERRFKVTNNPFGIVYNPVSITSSIERLIEGQTFCEEDLDENKGLWFSFAHHGRFSSFDRSECLENINNEFLKAVEKIRNASFLFITPGTSIVYRYKKSGKIVANCHKLPSQEFERHFLVSDQIEQEFENVINSLLEINPTIHIVFTVSPVRHWSEGATDNQLSKAILFHALHRIRNKFSNVSYFPAYELMMDDLRDYRFYAEDMLHPNQIAITYIWEKFLETYLSEEARRIAAKIENLIKARNHKAFYPDSEEHKKFLSKNLNIVQDLKTILPGIMLGDFEKYFSA
jgi:hypothetical protein